MIQRIGKAVVVAGVLLTLSGCVELTQTITVNPDGKGKVVYDVLMAAEQIELAPPDAKEKTLAEKLRAAAVNMLTKTKGVVAWKDVTVKWAADGRMHFVGTGYFERLDQLNDNSSKDGGGLSFNLPTQAFQLTREKDGSLKIAAKKQAADPKKLAAPDPKKMTDKELDEYLLKQRVDYQKAKPFLILMLTDLKIKTMFRLPGEVVETKGFKKDGPKAVSFSFDGDVMLAAIKKFMAQDNATIKKLLFQQPTAELWESFGLTPDMVEPSVTINKLGQPLFDFAKELQAARAAYPQLRQQFQMDANE
jgi:hypothetical protein